LPGRNTGGNKRVGGSGATQRGGPRFRRGPRNVAKPQFDEFGLPTDGKYRSLGPRNRKNVATAIREGFVYNTTSGTTEEQCCYGELRRRGFEVGENAGPRWFVPQFPLAGEIVDFAGANLGELFALRPNNRYWHGHESERRNLELGGEDIEQAGYTVFDIWDGDSLSDLGIEARFDLFFGAE
jgi:hypothetical protein